MRGVSLRRRSRWSRLVRGFPEEVLVLELKWRRVVNERGGNMGMR